MERSAIYHRPASEMAYMADKQNYRLQLKTKHRDITRVQVIFGAPQMLVKDSGQTDAWEYATKEMDKRLQNGIYNVWEVKLPIPATRKLKYAFHLLDREGNELLYDANLMQLYTPKAVQEMTGFLTPYLVLDETATTPEWTQKMIWYRLMPDRFANGDQKKDLKDILEWGQKADKAKFFGGDLQGIIDNLDHIQGLGFNGIYLSPVFDAYSNHKFDTIDYYEIDPAFGTKEKFKELIEAIHQRGMKVMLDITCDHLSDFSLQWQDVRKYGTRSSFAKWFLIKEFPVRYVPSELPDYSERLTYEALNNNPHMPKVDLENPEVQAYFGNILTYWTRNFDIDGWSIADSNEIPAAFKRYLLETLRQVKADIYLLGNTIAKKAEHDDVFAGNNSIDVRELVEGTFITKNIPPTELAYALNEHQLRADPSTLSASLLAADSPQTQRILAKCEGNVQLLRAVLAFMFMQPESPSILYGTEKGIKAGTEAALQPCMEWKDDQASAEMQRFLKTLLAMRIRYNNVLCEGSFEWGQCSNQYSYLSFSRRLGDKRLFALFNLGYGSIKIILPQNCKLLLGQNLVEQDKRLGQAGFAIVEL